MKKIIASIVSLATALSVFAFAAPVALALGVTVGNPAINRAVVDTRSDFTIIDTNHPVSATGWLTTFGYYASNQNPFEFVLVDGTNTVKWVSATITPAATGLQAYNSVVAVTAGWNLGVHFDSTGTIPFDYVGAAAPYTFGASGVPTVGSTLIIDNTSGRTYSWNGNGSDASTCATATLVSGTASQQAGFTETNPSATPLNTGSYSHAYAPAFATQTVIPPWIDPSADPNFTGSGAVWISTDATWPGGAGNTEGDPTHDQWRLFQDNSLPAAAVVTSGDVWYTGDNATAVYQNGTFLDRTGGATDDVFGPVPAGLPFVFESVFHTALTPSVGGGLNFVLRNWGGNFNPNPTGLLYKAVVNYCIPATPAPTECPAAPSVAAALLKSHGIKPGSSQTSNFISQVAHFMGPQTMFNGVNACNLSAYQAAVNAYLHSIHAY